MNSLQLLKEIKLKFDYLTAVQIILSDLNKEKKVIEKHLTKSKENFSKGRIAKFNYLKDLDENKQKYEKLILKEKQLKEKKLRLGKEIVNNLNLLKDLYAIRSNLENLGKIK